MKKILFIIPVLILTLTGCKNTGIIADEAGVQEVPIETQQEVEPEYVPIKIEIEKQLLYDKYALADTFPYRDTVRVFKWDKIREQLRVIDSVQMSKNTWAVLQNRQNKNGEAPLVKEWSMNDYKRVSDMRGTEKYQSVPLYSSEDHLVPEFYGHDGSWVKVVGSDTSDFVRVALIYPDEEWDIPAKYVKIIGDSVRFDHVVVADRADQYIATIEKSGDKWLVRSMNPATTGVRNPPYQHETPLGIFVIQEKKYKMYYYDDGTTTIAGYAPYASRFCNGGYIHGVPTNDPDGAMIEYSWSLGTIPRSHMCIRNATSHSKFIYDWAPVERSLVVVIE